MALYETYKMKLKIVTPVIINTGDDFEFCELYPTDKRVAEDGQVPYYKGRQINTANLFIGLNDNEIRQFIKSSEDAIYQRDKNNDKLTALRNLVLSKSTKEKTRIPCRFLEEAYEDLRDRPFQQVSKVMQEELCNTTYIPGSSIKGAIRTALLEKLRKDKGVYNEVDEKQVKNKFIENNLLNSSSVQSDPFKYLKISDFTFDGISGIQYIGKINNGTTTPIYSAMTSAYALTKNEIAATGTIEINPEFYKMLDLKNFTCLLGATKDFYVENIDSRRYDFKTKSMKDVYNYLVENLNGFSSPICLGHYIGIQNYTYNIIRTNPPKIPRSNPPRYLPEDINKVGGKNKTIEGGIFPGICILSKESK